MTHIPYKEDAEAYSFFDNTGWDYLVSLFLLFTYLIIFYIIKGIIVKQLKNFDSEDETFERVRQIGRALDEGITLFLGIVISINFALSPLNIPDAMEFILLLLFMGLIGFYTLKILKGIVRESAEYYTETNPELEHIVPFFSLLAKVFVTIVVILWYLSVLGINITAYLAGLSILALGIAFALQNLIADFFASLVIYFDKPFKVGDSIKVGSDSGKVIKIGIRSTHIRTSSGYLLVISNRELSTKRISNMSDRTKRRVVLNLRVYPSTQVATLKKLPIWVEAIVKKVEHTEFSRAHLTELAKDSWDYQVVYDITTPEYTIYLNAQQEVNLAILTKLESERVKIHHW